MSLKHKTTVSPGDAITAALWNEEHNISARKLYVGDETEVSVTGTTEESVKNFRMINSSTHGFSIKKIYVIAEMKVSAGTGSLKVYIDGATTPSLTLTTTSTSYVLVKGSFTVTWADDTIHTVDIRLVNDTSTATTYNRTLEFYIDGVG